MKSTLIFLALGLFLLLVAPLLWGDFISSVAATLPQFVWSKSPPRAFEFGLEAARFTPGYLHSRVERIRVKGSEGAPERVFEESFCHLVGPGLVGMVQEYRT